MEILLTNDDGIYSEGLTVLSQMFSALSNVTVVAPDREMSASSHSLTLHNSLHYICLNKNKYIITGTPSDCINFGVYKLLNKKVDYIISGINRGGNLGDDISYSGTVGAAMEGTLLGYRGLAFSLVDIGYGYNFKIIKNQMLMFIKKILKIKLPFKTFLNINIPSVKKIKGIKFTFQDSRKYPGGITMLKDLSDKPYFLIGSKPAVWDNINGSDYNAVMNGFISVTPIKIDFTDYSVLDKLLK